ncbi:hypothetical protein PLACP1_26490 [Planifilum fimeticola]
MSRQIFDRHQKTCDRYTRVSAAHDAPVSVGESATGAGAYLFGSNQNESITSIAGERRENQRKKINWDNIALENPPNLSVNTFMHPDIRDALEK